MDRKWIWGWPNVNRNEIRYKLISTLLQADGPLTFIELVIGSKIAEEEALPVLKDMVSGHLVVEGELLTDRPAPQYCWAARWEKEVKRRATGSKLKLRTIVNRASMTREERLDIDSEPVLAFNDYVINEYKPPVNKRLLVFLQCSVRRPFSSSPSHASMRRAISVATGYDPSKGFERCPVHVVVLASMIGPVPYELEDVYPANVGGGGVKHLDWAQYSHVKPILAERMARYIIAHRGSYDHISTFTESRYGEVMKDARKIAAVDFRILPMEKGARVMRMGRSIPRKYWEMYWIQLYLEIVSWLKPIQRANAEARLREMEVKYR